MSFLDIACPICGHVKNLTQYVQDRSLFFRCAECDEGVMVSIDVRPVRPIDTQLPAIAATSTAVGTQVLNSRFNKLERRLRAIERTQKERPNGRTESRQKAG